MTLVQIDTHAPGTEGWAQQRRGRIGGSDVAAALGISPWESRFSLWHRKQGGVPPVEDTPPMEWGRRLESVVLDKWRELHEPDELLSGTWERDGWMLANPDAIAIRDDARIIVEIKTARSGEDWEEGPPAYYLTQVQWYMAVLDLPVAWVAVLIGGSDYREFRVDASPDDQALMVSECRAFLDSITAGQRPDIDESYATFQAVRQLHPDIDATDAELPRGMANQLLQARRAHDAAKAEWQLHQSIVLDRMGNARNAIDPDGRRVAYRTARTIAGQPGTPYLAIDRKALS